MLYHIVTLEFTLKHELQAFENGTLKARLKIYG